MHTTYIQAFENEAAAQTAVGKMSALGYKVLLISGSDQAQLWGYPKQGKKDPIVIGEIDDTPVWVVVATKDTIMPNAAAAGN